MKLPTPLHDAFTECVDKLDKNMPPKIKAVFATVFLAGVVSYQIAEAKTEENPLLQMYLQREINDWLIELYKEDAQHGR